MATKKIRTMAEFAEKIGLSRPTVSKFFNDPASIRGTSRRKIEEALEYYDFKPNIFAMNLNRRQSKIIGLIIPDQTDHFYMALTRYIEVQANKAGFLAFTLSSDGNPDIEVSAIDTFASLNVSGAIMAPLGPTSHTEQIRTLGETIPLVFIDSRLDGDGPFVGTNNQQSMSLITDYLIRSGSKPTYFDMPHVNRNAIERRNAYLDAMKNAELEPCFAASSPSGSWNFEQYAFDETKAILNAGGFPTNTILCANDRLAFGVMSAAYQAGLKIGVEPGADIRIAGHDNHPLSAFSCPPLTTVAQDYKVLGELSFDLLLSKIKSKNPVDESSDIARLINGELKMRKSA